MQNGRSDAVVAAVIGGKTVQPETTAAMLMGWITTTWTFEVMTAVVMAEPQQHSIAPTPLYLI